MTALVDIEATVYPEQFGKKRKTKIIKYFTYIILTNKKIGYILTKKSGIFVVYLNFSVDKSKKVVYKVVDIIFKLYNCK